LYTPRPEQQKNNNNNNNKKKLKIKKEKKRAQPNYILNQTQTIFFPYYVNKLEIAFKIIHKRNATSSSSTKRPCKDL